LSQNDLHLHFGLGSHDHIDKAEIFWPSGATEVLAQLASDHFYTAREVQGVVGREGGRSLVEIRRSASVMPG
jgi:hypothetical protein